MLPQLPPARIEQIQNELLRWFDVSKRDLPWRKTKDAYAIWLSEIMLQQTQVITVIPYWEKFLREFPTVDALAEAPLERVLSMWQGLGYYTRARSLHRAAQQVVELHQGRLPDTLEALLELPGFGRYTAGAVASIAFNRRAPLVDGNVARVFARLFEVEGPTGDKVREQTLWHLAEQLVPESRPGDFNQALMELGALICRTDNPTCLLCPLRAHCGALASGRVKDLPAPKIRAPRKALRLAVAVWKKDEALLMARRPPDGLFGGLWELPSAEWTQGSASRALKQVLGEEVKVGAELELVERTLTHRDLSLQLHVVEGRKIPKKNKYFDEFRWVKAEEATDLGMSTAMRVAWKKAQTHVTSPRPSARNQRTK